MAKTKANPKLKTKLNAKAKPQANTKGKAKEVAKPKIKAAEKAKSPAVKVAKPTKSVKMPTSQAKLTKEKPAKQVKVEQSVSQTQASAKPEQNNKASFKAEKTEVAAKAPALSPQTLEKPQKLTIVPQTEEEARWLEYYNKHRAVKPQTYAMTGVFEEKTPVEHKVLGWGYILSVQNDRLEVLFRSGIKYLISNYKPN